MTTRTATLVHAVAVLALLVPAAAAAQPPAPPAAELEACARAAQAGDRAGAREAAARAEAGFRAELRARPADPGPRVGLARVISQCRIRFANFLGAGRMIGESNRLLEEALELEPGHWTARYTLALNHYHTPEFLGRTNEAIRHLEVLREQQGERADEPQLAGTFVYLGELYRRVGRQEDALRTWRQGARLFPGSAALRERAGAATEPVPGDVAPAAAQAPADTAAARYAVDGVTVRARRLAPQAAASGTALDRLQVATAPGGTGDLLHVLRMEAGVGQGTDGSDLYVRGGEPAETPVWLDGGRMFYPGTFETLHGGLFGAIDPAVMSEAYFSGGGFSARYGNALSGVLDVRTEGRPAAPRLSVGANLAGASATGRAPLGARGGVWGTGRVTDATLLVRMQGLGETYDRMPQAAQTTLGAVYAPRPGAELKATLLLEEDAAGRHVESHGHAGAFRARGGTRLGVLSAATARDDGARVQGTLSLSRRATGFRFGVLDHERSDRGVSAALAGSLPLGPLSLRAGAEAHRLTLEESGVAPTTGVVAPGSPSERVDSAASARHLGAHLETELRAGSGVSLLAGVRVDRLPGEAEWTADPRATLAVRAGGWTTRLAAGVFHQGRWRTGYRVPDAGVPGGIPLRATHLVVGVEQEGEAGLRLEAYVKRYGRYVAQGEGPQTTEAVLTGADARARWALGDLLSGWVVYSWMHSALTLEDGSEVPARADVTHAVTAVGRLAMGQRWELGGTLRLATGRPHTPVLGADTAAGAPRQVYGDVHGERLPDYARLDVRLTHVGELGGRRAVAFAELLNALDRRNVMGYSYDAAHRERRPIESFFARRVVVIGTEIQVR